MFNGTITYKKIGYQAYAVTAHKDGQSVPVGSVKRKWFPHIQMDAWIASGTDGHRGVHEHRWRAAGALVWDGQGYPFPIIVRPRNVA